jgi:hypothetical protein
MNGLLRLALGVAVVGLAPTLGSAAPKKIKVPSANPYGAIVLQLQQAQFLLVGANHDYASHRGKAVHQVTNALRALGGTPVGKRSGGAIVENQGASDAQLTQAAGQLMGIANQLATAPGDPNAASARTSALAAVQEINLALKVR